MSVHRLFDAMSHIRRIWRNLLIFLAEMNHHSVITDSEEHWR